VVSLEVYLMIIIMSYNFSLSKLANNENYKSENFKSENYKSFRLCVQVVICRTSMKRQFLREFERDEKIYVKIVWSLHHRGIFFYIRSIKYHIEN
jgi:hypothetical protein